MRYSIHTHISLHIFAFFSLPAPSPDNFLIPKHNFVINRKIISSYIFQNNFSVFCVCVCDVCVCLYGKDGACHLSMEFQKDFRFIFHKFLAIFRLFQCFEHFSPLFQTQNKFRVSTTANICF
jgi:hypothetical protein